MPELLPHRFRESQFRKYEPYIRDIVREYPKVCRFKPPMAMATFVSRLRDAMTSFKQHQWKSDIDWATFINLRNAAKIQVRENLDGYVYCGDPESLDSVLKSITQPPDSMIVGNTTAAPTISIPDLSSLEALCELLSKGVLSGPYTLVGEKITLDVIQSLESRFNIAIVSDENGTIIT